MKFVAFLVSHAPTVAFAASSGTHLCKNVKEFYQDQTCCGNLDTHTGHQIIPMKISGNKFDAYSNQCDGKKLPLDNLDCFKENLEALVEQSGADITVNQSGTIDTSVVPLTVPYWTLAMCPVNVHWHIGTEHRSAGQFDETNADKGPADSGTSERRGFRCNHYDANDVKFTTEYKWKYCSKMKVGETYEIHWPHSALGACGTTDQYQYPFYDGVFCNFGDSNNDGQVDASDLPQPQGLANAVGVQGQVFTVVNDETYYYPDLIRGMIHEGDYGKDITYYTGSTTGTTRDNKMCSQYAPITWQVDRTCHLISASSFDKMCADMLAQKDDMSTDTHPHGARELVWANLSADNHQYRRLNDVEVQIDVMVYEA